MSNLNYIFFEEFKHLEKLCREIYQSNSGVSDYINDMEKVSAKDFRNIKDWERDLKQLKRLRKIRNTLAHVEGAFSQNICTQNDIDWLKEFYQRIMKQTDPIALLRQNSKTTYPISKQQTIKQVDLDNIKEFTFTERKNNEEENAKYSWKDILIGFGLVIVLIIVLIMVVLTAYFTYLMYQ